MTSQPLLKLEKDCRKMICTINNFLTEVKKKNNKLIKLMIVPRKMYSQHTLRKAWLLIVTKLKTIFLFKQTTQWFTWVTPVRFWQNCDNFGFCCGLTNSWNSDTWQKFSTKTVNVMLWGKKSFFWNTVFQIKYTWLKMLLVFCLSQL